MKYMTIQLKALTLRIEENGGNVKIYEDRELDPWDWINANYPDRMDTDSTDFGKINRIQRNCLQLLRQAKRWKIFSCFIIRTTIPQAHVNPLDRMSG